MMGMWENLQGNPNITWEKAKKFDFGVEFSVLNGMLSLEADYFYEKRSNMLMAPNALVPAEYGIPLSQVNAGSMHCLLYTSLYRSCRGRLLESAL